jgi:hypothetical protein
MTVCTVYVIQNMLSSDYKLCESPITSTDCIKDLGVLIRSKFHFYHHVDYIFSQTIGLLELVLIVAFVPPNMFALWQRCIFLF